MPRYDHCTFTGREQYTVKHLSFLFSILLVSSVAHAEYTTLFTLGRTLNKNEVVYEADFANKSAPIHAYWIMHAQDGHREELTRLERNKAYGIEVVSQKQDEIQFIIKAFRTHPIIVKKDSLTSKPYSILKINLQDKILKNIFLHLAGTLFPSVTSIDIFYQNVKDGPVLRESYDPNG